MLQIKPFKGVVYNKGEIGDIGLVVAPPYDVISKARQSKLYGEHPYNIVRLILGKIRKSDNSKDNRYIRAKKHFDSWLRQDVLVRDEKKSLYIYSQKYKENKKTVSRIGFIGLMGLDRIGRNKVMPHENTLLAPKVDRLSLMRSVGANLSPIFILYNDPIHRVIGMLKKYRSGKYAAIDVEVDGVRHRLWKMDDNAAIKKVQSLMRNADTYIADGHHRYEVARMYCAEIAKSKAPESLKKNARYMMVYFVEADDRMLTILPAHRIIRDIGALRKNDVETRIGRFFYLERVPDLNRVMSRLEESKDAHGFGMYAGNNNFYSLKLKDAKASDAVIKDKPGEWKRLDVSILHLFVFQHVLGVKDDDDNIEFVEDPKEAVKLIDKDKGKLAFFLNPTKVSQVKQIAKLGERMPRKATYFYPKPLSGLVINKF